MKPKEFNQILENLISKEIRKNIIMESETKDVYHIKCEGEPIDTFKTREEAESHLDIYKKDHPGKQFIIEKGKYNTYDEMIDKLDEMGQELEEKENKTQDMKKDKIKVGSFAEAIMHAKENNKSTIKINGEEHDVEECWKQIEEEEEYGDKYMEEGEKCEKCGKEICECGYMEEEEECDECGDKYMEEEEVEKCPKCKKEKCECEKTPKKLKLKENELIDLINKMVKESVSGVPGITVTKKAQDGSKKENKSHSNEVGAKMKKYLSFDGNDNPEFPKPIGKGEKMTIQTTDEENEYIEDTRGSGPQHLKYDHEPSEKFKERLKASLEGDSKMGNSNEAANVVDNGLGEKMVKQIKRKYDKENKYPMYNKDEQPVGKMKPKEKYIGVNESKKEISSLIKEDISKMMKISGYNKKTQ